MFTQKDVDKAFKDGRQQALIEAAAVAEAEVRGAQKELDAAAKTGNFAAATIDRTKVRQTYAKKILAAIRKIKP